jgi:dipeptidyl aminopeptidase/acylaminoacyl peptidase
VDAQPYELHTYPGDNHNISANFGVAMQRTVAFFDEYVKGQ